MERIKQLGLKRIAQEIGATIVLVGIASGFIGACVEADFADGGNLAAAMVMVASPVAILAALKLAVDWLAARY